MLTAIEKQIRGLYHRIEKKTQDFLRSIATWQKQFNAPQAL